MSTQTIGSTLLLIAVSACSFAQSNVRDVRNAAGNLMPRLPGYGIARGSLISISGAASGDPQSANFPLSANLNGVSVKIVAGGQEVDALMVSVTASRIIALVPSQAPTGAGIVRVTDANGTIDLNVTIIERNFGIFAQKSAANSVGGAYAMNLSDGGNVWNSLTTPAMPGQNVAILGSGAGATTQDETNAVAAESLTGDFKLYIGGKLATIVSTGRNGMGIDALGLPTGLAGIDSIVATVPAGLSGCRVAVETITDNARVSNFATISVAPDGGACSDPGILSSDDINNLPASGFYSTGNVLITRSTVSLASPIGNIDLNNDSATAGFSKIDVNDFRSSGGGGYYTVGSCIVTYFTTDDLSVDNAALPALLDAGPAINIKGPTGTTTLGRNPGGDYASATAVGSNSPFFPSQGTPFAEPGAFTAGNGAGGADVKAFTVNLTNPKPFIWTNQAQITDVIRSQGVTITWTGGASDATVSIGGSSPGAGNIVSSFGCTAPASAGSFQVPAAVTLALTPTGGSTGASIPGAFAVLSSTYSHFTAAGLDQGVFASASGSSKNVTFR